MGKVIDIEQRRRAARAQPAVTGAGMVGLQEVPFAMTEAVLRPSAVFWQIWFSTWSSFWLAPMGLEMRPVNPDRPPAAPGQINRNR